MLDDLGPTRLDVLLGGRVRLCQPVQGYRAATDPVLLAASIPARPGQSVLDLGLGAGAASLCLAARVPGLDLHGVDLQPGFVALARQNAARNAAPLTAHLGDVAALPPDLRARSFDHVMLNPPYFPGDTSASPLPARDMAQREGAADLAVWLATALSRTRPGAWVTLIHRAERLAEILAALSPRAGDIRILPLTPRQGRDAKRVIVAARKGSRTPLRLLAPLVLHQGPAHVADGDDFTPQAQAILRDAAPLWPDA